MSTYKIALIVGSLRRDSFNRKLAGALAKLAPSEFKFTELGIGDLPPYNQDDDDNQASQVKRLKAEIAGSDGVIFVTPEYNRSIPGVLKNAIDHASRPYGQSALGRQARLRDRRLARCHRHRAGAAASAQYHRLSRYAHARPARGICSIQG